MASTLKREPLAYAVHRTFEPFDSGVRSFPRHYLLYASAGAFHLTIGGRDWLLPPQRAAWIRSHVDMRVVAKMTVTNASVLFQPDALPPQSEDCLVFQVPLLAREMILYAMRWGPERDADDAEADRFFLSLASVCQEQLREPMPYWLPRPQSDMVGQAVASRPAASIFED